MSRIDGTAAPVVVPEAHEEPSFESDLASTLAAALLRLEEESQERRELSRGERRRALEMRHDAIQEAKAAARKERNAKLVGLSLDLGAGALNAVGGGASGAGTKASRLCKAGAELLKAGGDLSRATLEHGSKLEQLGADSTTAGSEGMNVVAEEHRDAAEGAERSVERARELLTRVIEGEHAQRMAALRG